MNSKWWYEYVLRLRRDATVYLKYKKIVIWQIKVFFKFLGVIKINFILLVQPSILHTPGSNGDQIRYLKAISNSSGRGSIGPKLNF